MKLTINMRIQHQENVEEKNFVDFLLKMGEGKIEVDSDLGDDYIKLPDDIVFDKTTFNELISEIFKDINTKYQTNDYNDYIKDRVILSTKNNDVEEINQQVLEIIPDQSKYEYFSADSVQAKDEVDSSLYPLEFLNTLTPSGMPPHKLVLKKDVLVILLRNLNPAEGLCNGTRLIIKECYQNTIDAEILTGVNQGKRIFLP